MVVLESMAAGVPVVAAKVGGVPDLIEEGKTGFFCDPYDLTSIRNAVEKLLTDTTTASQIAKTAKSTAYERFHPRAIARKHVEVYQEVLSRSS